MKHANPLRPIDLS
jgi:hypothetical protein